MVHDIYLAYHIFRFRGNMGLSKFILIFTEMNESNKVLLSEENTYDWYNLYIAKQTAEFYEIKQCHRDK